MDETDVYSGFLADVRDETKDKYSSVGGFDFLECQIFACPQTKHLLLQCKIKLLHLHFLNSQWNLFLLITNNDTVSLHIIGILFFLLLSIHCLFIIAVIFLKRYVKNKRPLWNKCDTIPLVFTIPVLYVIYVATFRRIIVFDFGYRVIIL
jgi:hypothetical protein